jgi:uncharacterized membrane protein
VKHVLQVVFLALVLTALTQVFWQHGHLPERVAAHFDGAGRANGWVARGTHTGLHVATILFMTVLFQGIALLPARLPREYVNLPHRDYWLAPERAAATHAWVAGMVLTLGCTVMLFFISLFRLVYLANLTDPPQLTGAVWWFAAGLLAMTGTVVAALVSRFARRPAA